MGNESAVLFPLIKYKSHLRRAYSIEITFCKSVEELCRDQMDVIILSSWYFGRKKNLWKKSKKTLFENLLRLKNHCDTLIWYDISDSTGTTQFEVLNYVDLYLKCQLLKDTKQYLKKSKSGRIFGDFNIKHFGVKDSYCQEKHLTKPINPDHVDKLKLGWNTGLADYGLLAPFRTRLNSGIKFFLNYPNIYCHHSRNRPKDISCRFNKKYTRKSVAIGREKTSEILSSYMETDKINRLMYFNEMARSKLAISPFGLGEITLRDFEIFLCGALLLKPKMSHLLTWPNFYSKDTYVAYNWDLMDLAEKINTCIDNYKLFEEIAEEGQSRYIEYTHGKKAKNLFCDYFTKIVSNSRKSG